MWKLWSGRLVCTFLSMFTFRHSLITFNWHLQSIYWACPTFFFPSSFPDGIADCVETTGSVFFLFLSSGYDHQDFGRNQRRHPLRDGFWASSTNSKCPSQNIQKKKKDSYQNSGREGWPFSCQGGRRNHPVTLRCLLTSFLLFLPPYRSPVIFSGFQTDKTVGTDVSHYAYCLPSLLSVCKMIVIIYERVPSSKLCICTLKKREPTV